MAHEPLSAQTMRKALSALDSRLDRDVSLIVGGGGALALAHGLALSTHDIDAVPRGMSLAEIDGHVKAVAAELGLPGDWLNPYFSTFSHTLPEDYEGRLIRVFDGKRLKADALGKEEMLIMKCFAGRMKDVSHARALLRKGADRRFVERHLEHLLSRGIPGAREAIDFLDELEDGA